LEWRGDRALWTIIGLAALLGLIYNAVMLPGFGPDEPRHFHYVRLLFSEHRLPFMDAAGHEYGGAHSYHPPLYYFFQLPFYAAASVLPAAAAYHVMRLGSLLLCLLALPLAYQVAWRAGGGSRDVARLATAQIALLPLFGMAEGVINNDGATILASIGFVWLLAVKFPEARDVRSALCIGAALGLGALCKGSVILADLAALAVYFVLQSRRQKSLIQSGENAARGESKWQNSGRWAIAAAVGFAIAAPWYGRNVALYGHWQPIPMGFSNPALPRPETGVLTMMMHDNFPPLFAYANWGIFYTLWSQKDWIPETIRTTIYLLLLAYCLAALSGCIKARRQRKPGHSVISQTKSVETPTISDFSASMAIYTSLAGFVFTWFSCLYIALFVHWGQAEGGRYLLPSFLGLSVALSLGWRAWLSPRRFQSLTTAWCAAMLLLNAVAVYWLLAYLNPTYGPK
jgi:4-amino-4-deoxy-L-arabinose transferase-like glycosyltransferase